MKYLLGIPYVNRPDLLREALNSVKPFWPYTLLIDNSLQRELSTNLGASNFLPPGVKVYQPSVPLTFSQSMNLLQDLAKEQQCDAILYMHNDAAAQPGTPEAFLSILESLVNDPNKKWGVLFTNYDTLAAYNVEAARVVGRWDTTFPDYFSDNDYYRRLKLAGYELVESNLAVSHHGSSTINSNESLAFKTSVTFPLYQLYYQTKWGGPTGKEKFQTPFNKATNITDW